MEKKITVQVSTRYEWPETDVSRLRKPIEDYLLPLMPGANYTNGSVMHPGAGDIQQQTDFSDVRDWLEALSQPAASYRLWMAQGADNLSLNIANGSIDVTIRGETGRADEFRTQLEQFAASAGLKPKKSAAPIAAVAASAFKRAGNYRLLEDVTADAWLKASDLFVWWVGKPLTFTGNLVVKADPGSTQEIRDVSKWREAISKQWADLASVVVFANGPGRGVMLRLQFADRTVGLNVTAEDAQAGKELFGTFESTLKVAPQVAPGADAAFKEQQRRYYIANPITDDWVRDKLLATLVRVAADKTGGGTFRVADQEYTVPGLDAWKNEVELRWKDMQAARFWVQTADSRQSLDVDFNREQVSVTLRDRTGTKAPARTFADYESELDLVPAPPNPYQYYRYARKYQKSGEWDTGTNKVLADAIDKAVRTAFPDGRYVFVNGSTTAGEAAQEQTPHPNLDHFLQRLRQGDPYVKSQIYLQGPRGNDLAVRLEPGENNVELRSSISDGQLFKKVAEPFDKIHDLKEYDSEHRNAAGEVQKKKSALETWMPLISGAPGFLLALAAFLVTALPAQKDTLEIKTPKEGAVISGNSCTVTWGVKHTRLFREETWKTPKASVQVMKPDGSDRKDFADADSGLQVQSLADGEYDVTVSVAPMEPQVVHITAKTPSPPPDQKMQKKPPG